MMEANALNKSAIKKLIEAEYHRRGDGMGWRLLYCPWDLADGAEAAFIGLNPGGDENNAGHGEIDTAGSAYKFEDWSTKRREFSPGCAPLQLQVRTLFDGLGVDLDGFWRATSCPFDLDTGKL